jgi:hypothetical protein
MAVRKMYRKVEETARHRQMKQLCLDYFYWYEKMISKPTSQLYASKCRKACVRLKRVAHARGLELLELYSAIRNGDLPYNQKRKLKEQQNG